MTFRVGLIGTGGIARAHAQGYELNRNIAKVVAVTDVQRAFAEQLGKQLEADVEENWETLLQRDDIDGVDICLPHVLHAPVAIAAAKAGKHVLVEKPMAMTLDEARTMVDAHNESGTTLMVAQHQRYQSDHRKLKELLDAGALGRIFSARVDCNQYLYGAAPNGHWLNSKEMSGGGAVISVVVHKIDLLRYLIGEVKRAASFQLTSGINPGMDCEDVSTAIIQFENGAIAEVFSSYASHRNPFPGTDELLILYGEHGTLSNVGGWHLYSTALPEYSGGMTRLELWSDNAMANEIRHWIESIAAGTEPLSSGRDNLKTMAVVDAIYRSADTGQITTVTPA
ncbi:MAG: Gfo/Idh/MocA family protein [Thermomicrobiales bacterium]